MTSFASLFTAIVIAYGIDIVFGIVLAIITYIVGKVAVFMLDV